MPKMQVDCKLLTGNVHSIPAEQDETISIVRQRLAQRVGGTVSFKLMHQVPAASQKAFVLLNIYENFVHAARWLQGHILPDDMAVSLLQLQPGSFLVCAWRAMASTDAASGLHAWMHVTGSSVEAN